MAKKRRKANAQRRKVRTKEEAERWTFLEKALGVIVAVMVLITAYAVLSRDEIVEVETIQTYVGEVDLRADDPDASSYSFEKVVKKDYQVRVRFTIVQAGPVVLFKVWNSTTNTTLIEGATRTTFDELYRVAPGEAGNYEFLWWVEDGSGHSRVRLDVLVQPTEKIFEKKR